MTDVLLSANHKKALVFFLLKFCNSTKKSVRNINYSLLLNAVNAKFNASVTVSGS